MSSQRHSGASHRGAGHSHHGEGSPRSDHDEEELATLLELDAALSSEQLAAVHEWVSQLVTEPPQLVVDLGAGAGSGTVALAERHPSATVVAVDSSASMLQRVRRLAEQRGLSDRVRREITDLDSGLPELPAVDLVWTASVLHELADPARVLAQVHAAMRPGGLLVVVEMDTLPRVLPDDLGLGRAGLEDRCHQALTKAGWNAHPDWAPQLQVAGFELVGQRSFPSVATAGAAGSGHFAVGWLSRIRSALRDQLEADDLAVLDQLLASDGPHGLRHRQDVVVRGSRTVWAARRPGGGGGLSAGG